jgi:hypothetical protein
MSGNENGISRDCSFLIAVVTLIQLNRLNIVDVTNDEYFKASSLVFTFPVCSLRIFERNG